MGTQVPLFKHSVSFRQRSIPDRVWLHLTPVRLEGQEQMMSPDVLFIEQFPSPHGLGSHALISCSQYLPVKPVVHVQVAL